MRTDNCPLAAALWPKARRRILGLLLANPEREWHLRDIARQTKLAPATVHSEVLSLHEAGVLTRRRDGQQVKYGADHSCPIISELQGIILKTIGLADVFKEALQPLTDCIEVAFVFGSLARGEASSESDVDLMVVGETGLQELVPAVRKVTAALHREINPIVMDAEEFRKRLGNQEHFLSSVLDEPKIFVIGDEDDLGRLAEATEAAEA